MNEANRPPSCAALLCVCATLPPLEPLNPADQGSSSHVAGASCARYGRPFIEATMPAGETGHLMGVTGGDLPANLPQRAPDYRGILGPLEARSI
jgi:hypothetical protein